MLKQDTLPDNQSVEITPEETKSLSKGTENVALQFKNIFRTTFLFSFVKVFQIVLGVVRNKVIAVLLGADGVGMIGLFNSTISFIQTGTSLGIHQSAVRDVSEANGQNDKKRFSRIISMTNKVILFTGGLGFFVTVIASPWLSLWTFGNYRYTLAYALLGSVVGMQTFSNGQLAILTGMRQLKALAKASMVGAIVGLITSVPLYFFFGTDGIVPSLIVAALSALLVSSFYVRKIDYIRIRFSFREFTSESSSMVKMGISLMLVSFTIALFNLVVSAYIRSHGGLNIVGYYNAGTTIISSYFGIVITAMTTDYYPRISAVNNDNTQLTKEVNRQSEVGLVMVFPLAVLFVFLSPFILKFLYSEEFLRATAFTDYAIFGTVILICSNSMGMILLAKQASRIFIVSVLGQRLVCLVVYILMYKWFGLFGLGLSYLIMMAIHFLISALIMGFFYRIYFSKHILLILPLALATLGATVWARNIPAVHLRYLVGMVLICLVFFSSYWNMKHRMNIDVFRILKGKLK